MKDSSATASLTQWFVLCSCELKEVHELPEVDLCPICLKRKEAGRAGSFTQWIFRSDTCSCAAADFQKLPDIGEATRAEPTQSASYSAAISSESNDLPLETELSRQSEGVSFHDLHAENFPHERYEPLELLGSGMFGKVYRCHDKLLGKVVAVKTLRSRSEKELVAFQLEAKEQSKLAHPGIVTIFDFGSTDSGCPFMVMEYVPGLGLDKLRRSSGCLSWEDVCRIICSVCDALSYAHKNHVYHRDLKPSNILIQAGKDDESRSVRLIDFAVGQPIEPLQEGTPSVAAPLGTPLYMSPDIFLNRQYSEASEIYSLGCIMFECLTGRPPFIGETALHTLSMHARLAPPAPSQVNSSAAIPEIVDEIVLRCLRKIPEERFKTAAALKRELEHALQKTDLASRQSQAVSVFVPPQPKKQVLRYAVAILLTGALVFAIGARPWQAAPGKSKVRLFNSPYIRGESQKGITPEVETTKAGIAYGPERTFESLFKYDSAKGFWRFRNVSQNLDDGNQRLQDRDIKLLKGRNIRALSLGEQPDLTDDACVDLAELPLGSLDISSSKITDRGFSLLAGIPTLRTFAFGRGNLTKDAVRFLKPDLNSVDLSHNEIDDQALSYLRNLKHLSALNLTDTGINGSGLRHITHLSLTWLKLEGCRISDEGIAGLSGNRSIHSLDLAGCNVSAAGLEKLKGMPLKMLCLRGCPRIDDNAVSLIVSEFPHLIKLDLTNTAVKPAGLKELCRLEDLSDLILDGLPLGDADLEPVYRLHKLQKLSLSSTRITDKTLDRLARAHHDRVMPLLHDLIVRWVGITDDAAVRAEKEIHFVLAVATKDRESAAAEIIDKFTSDVGSQIEGRNELKIRGVKPDTKGSTGQALDETK